MAVLKNSVVIAGMAILGLVMSACSNTPIYKPAPAVSEKGSDWTYQVGPGDSVNVFVWRNPDVSGTFPVRADGKMTMNLVEDLPASGKTPSQLARDIEKSLSKYIQEPIVTVTVANGVGTYGQQVRVVGEAAKPQALNYREHMSLIDLMIAVGGLTDYAAGNKAYILRTEDGQTTPLGVRLEDLVKGGEYSANVEMRPGDVLVIPERLF
jgi:polysaccharide export outer membrane protein